MRDFIFFSIILVFFFIPGCNSGRNNDKYSPEIISLIEKLGSEDIKTVIKAQKKLIERREEAFYPLLDALKNENPDIRGGAAYTLGQIGDERAVKPLIKTLEDEDVTVRLWAIQALGYMKANEALPYLLPILYDKDVMIKAFAAYALIKIGNKKSIGPLKVALEKEKNPYTIKIFNKAITQLEQDIPVSQSTENNLP